MKKLVVLLTFGLLLLLSANVFAADGDLYVNGKVGIGTTTPYAPLTISTWKGSAPAGVNGIAVFTGGYAGNNTQGQAIDFLIDNSSTFPGSRIVSSMTTASGGELQFHTTPNYVTTAPTERMVIDANGNVGIGTMIPIDILHVAKERANNGTDNLAQIVISGSGATNDRLLLGYNTAADNGFIQSVHNALSYTSLLLNPNGGNVGIGTASPRYTLDVNGYIGIKSGVDIYNNFNADYIHVTYYNSGFALMDVPGADLALQSSVYSNRNVVIGNTTAAGYKLYVNGSLWAASFNNPSDIRWKKNVQPLENSLEKVLQLQGVSYDWRQDIKDRKFDTGRQIGFIAQDVEKIIPEVVKTDSEGYKALAYEKLTAVLVEAIKEQQKEIEKLKAEITKLQKY